MSSPLETIANTINDLVLLITKALPGEEQQLAAFKLRSPKMYARIQKHIVTDIVRYCLRKNITGEAVTDYVTLETEDYPVSEQALFISVVKAEMIAVTK